MLTVDDAPDWDEEAIERAMERAQTIAEWDEAAAADMRRLALSARAKRQGASVLIRAPFDPMRIYARMAKFYKWPHVEMEQMHFVTFFAYVREANQINLEEEQAYERTRRTPGGAAQPGSAEGLFAVAEPYSGETVAI